MAIVTLEVCALLGAVGLKKLEKALETPKRRR